MTDFKNDYDGMKHFLNITRGIKKRSMLKEDTSKTQLTPDEIAQEEETFRQAVSNAVEFEKFVIYDNSIEWRGTLPQLKISWVYDSSDNNGVYIQIPELIQLTEEASQTIAKLVAYFGEWSAKWNQDLYSDGNNGGEQKPQ